MTSPPQGRPSRTPRGPGCPRRGAGEEPAVCAEHGVINTRGVEPFGRGSEAAAPASAAVTVRGSAASSGAVAEQCPRVRPGVVAGRSVWTGPVVGGWAGHPAVAAASVPGARLGTSAAALVPSLGGCSVLGACLLQPARPVMVAALARCGSQLSRPLDDEPAGGPTWVGFVSSPYLRGTLPKPRTGTGAGCPPAARLLLSSRRPGSRARRSCVSPFHPRGPSRP